MFTVETNFIGIFKLGDNINHNLRILRYLYTCTGNEAWVLKKIKIILIGSICEAILYDLLFRINRFTLEGVKGFSTKVIAAIQGSKVDDFSKYIDMAKKQELLGNNDDPIYESLHQLRKLRNRVHIQNEKNHFEPNDTEAFNTDRLIESERVLEILAKTMSTNHSRGEHARCVADFEFPWDEHFR